MMKHPIVLFKILSLQHNAYLLNQVLLIMQSKCSETAIKQEHYQVEGNHSHISVKSRLIILVNFHQSSSYEEELKYQNKESLDIVYQPAVERVGIQKKFKLTINGHDIKSASHLVSNKLHLLRTVYQVETDRKLMLKTADYYYVLTCYSLQKSLKTTTFIRLNINKKVQQYVQKIDEELAQNIYPTCARQNTTSEIYLHRTQCTILDQYLRKLCYQLHHFPKNKNKGKKENDLSQSQEGIREQKGKDLR